MKIPRKRLFISLSLLVLFIIGIQSFATLSDVCACGTVNEAVISDLQYARKIIYEYSREHGDNPTPEELVNLIGKKHLNVRKSFVVKDKSYILGIPALSGSRAIYYATSKDRKKFWLMGVGLSEKRIYIRYGKNEYKIVVGHKYPILQPDDKPPANSPPAE